MHKEPRRRNAARQLLAASVAAGFGLAPGAPTAPASANPIATVSACDFPAFAAAQSFHREHVLGTSMHLLIGGGLNSAAAVECEHLVLDEIARLSSILSTYDASSEISRVMRGAPIESRELIEVLSLYETWNQRSGGAIHVNALAGHPLHHRPPIIPRGPTLRIVCTGRLMRS